MKTLVLVLVVVLCACAVDAFVPQTMSYQGVLRDASGNVAPDGVHNLTFRIYDVDGGGTALWTEAQMVLIEGGIVNAVLGHSVPLDLPFDTAYWLGITIDDDPELLPRTELTSAPYALHAAYADEGAPDGDWIMNGVNIYRGDGNVGIGLPTPMEKLEVVGTVKTTGFQLTTAPAPGHVLMSDAAGVGTWQPSAGGVGGGGTAEYVPKFTGVTTIGNSIIYETGGQVTIGTTTTDGKLTVENAGDVPTLSLTNTASNTGSPALVVEKTQSQHSVGTVARFIAPMATSNGLFLQCNREDESSGWNAFYVTLDGLAKSTGIYIDPLNDRERSIWASNTYLHNDARVVYARYAGAGAYDAVAVYGESKPQDYYGIGGQFAGGYIAVDGRVEPTGSESYMGLRGAVEGGSGSNFGVVGNAMNGDSNIGIYGAAGGGSESWAGYFDGNVRVAGTFSNPGPVLEMDHPSDPESRYLRHALVASPEMKTIYDGTVVLDADGTTWVVVRGPQRRLPLPAHAHRRPSAASVCGRDRERRPFPHRRGRARDERVVDGDRDPARRLRETAPARCRRREGTQGQRTLSEPRGVRRVAGTRDRQVRGG